MSLVKELIDVHYFILKVFDYFCFQLLVLLRYSCVRGRRISCLFSIASRFLRWLCSSLQMFWTKNKRCNTSTKDCNKLILVKSQMFFSTSEYELCFGQEDKDSNLLKVYADADYACNTDTRRSTTGFIFLMNDERIAWATQRQRCTSL